MLIGCVDDLILVLIDDYVLMWYVWLFMCGFEWYVEDLGLINGIYLDRVKVMIVV